jgi:hypothetical protein
MAYKNKPGKYPTLRRIDAKHWESEEQLDGVPDFTITRTSATTIRLKQRTAQKGWLFNTFQQAFDYLDAAWS